jgi:endonuclease G
MAGILYVVTGPVLRSGLPTIGDGVSIPEYFYKALYDPGENRAIGFLLWNEGSKQPLRSFVVSVDSLEILTGLDFFPSVPDSIEAVVDYNQWKTNK